MQRKFEAGDKVRFTSRCPQFVKDTVRGRTRTIVKAVYSPDRQASLYLLGDNNKAPQGVMCYRSYELKEAPKTRKPGRPRQKRVYKKRNKVYWKLPEGQLSGKGFTPLGDKSPISLTPVDRGGLNQ